MIMEKVHRQNIRLKKRFIASICPKFRIMLLICHYLYKFKKIFFKADCIDVLILLVAPILWKEQFFCVMLCGFLRSTSSLQIYMQNTEQD